MILIVSKSILIEGFLPKHILSLPTARAVLEGKVQGVVVQAKM